MKLKKLVICDRNEKYLQDLQEYLTRKKLTPKVLQMLFLFYNPKKDKTALCILTVLEVTSSSVFPTAP